MSSPKGKLDHVEGETEATDTREVYLKDGRTLSVQDGEIVEIRSSSGMVEVRIQLTEAGPVLQMESARLSLKAAEAVEIESKRVEIKATEAVTVESGGTLDLTSEGDTKVDSEGDIRIHSGTENGKKIWLN